MLEEKIDLLIKTLAENTAALNRVVAITAVLNESRGVAIDQIKAANEKGAELTGKPATPKATTAGKGKATTAKSNISEEPENRQDPANPEGDEEAQAAAAKAASEKVKASPVGKIVSKYLGEIDHPEAGDERDARKAKVDKLLTKLGATKLSEISADDEESFIDAITTLIERGNVLPVPEAATKKASLLDD